MSLIHQSLCSIVVVTYNGKALLERFLPSIMNQDYPNFEVVIVDNASQDGSIEFIEKNYPKAVLVKSNENLGTAEGSNLGARHTKGDYIFWVSNDMELEPHFLSYLIETAQSDDQIGITTCKMRRITADGQKLNIIDSVGSDLDVFGFPKARGIAEEDTGQLDFKTEVFFSFGGAMLIKKNVLDHIGGYDPAVFTLADDIDLSWRARLAGYKVVADPRAVLYHRVSATLSAISRGQRRFLSERNTLRMILKNYSLLTLLWILPGYFMLLAGEILFYCMIGKFEVAKGVLRALGWNIFLLSETMSLRRDVQKLRKAGDNIIRGYMLKTPQKLSLFIDFLKNPKGPNWQNFFTHTSAAAHKKVS
ncbi:glycosyltransferase family 2 protein [Elusimicrobiota bacterium]